AVVARRVGGKVEAPIPRDGVAKRSPPRVHPEIHPVPIIQSRPPDLALVERESQWLDEMERGIGGRAEPCDAAGVGRYPRLDQHHVHGQTGRRDDGTAGCWSRGSAACRATGALPAFPPSRLPALPATRVHLSVRI